MISQKYGFQTLLINLEFRLPFLIYYFPTIKYLGQINGVIFIDSGSAWNSKFKNPFKVDSWNNINDNEGWIMSYGFGPRFYFLGMPWKLDYAWQYNPYKGTTSSRHWYLSVGFDLSPNINSNGELLDDDWDDMYDFIDRLKINYYHRNNIKNNELHLQYGHINNYTFAQGYLLKN